MPRIDKLRAIAEHLNNNPVDLPTEDWGPLNLSSSYIAKELEDRVRPHGKLFRRKKLAYESGLVLYIYSYPSYRLFELIRSDSLLKECRGLIMSPVGVRNRPFPVIPTIDWSEALNRVEKETASVKINGTMITGLVTKNGIVLIGKGGKERVETKAYAERMKTLVQDADILGLTPIFEVTDKDHPLVLREESGCYLVGLRSIRTGRMACIADLVNLSVHYNLLHPPIIDRNDMERLDRHIEGVVFNDGETIVRSKTDAFRKLQKITSILRYNRRGDLSDLIHEVDHESLQYNLTTKELDDLTGRQLL